MYRKLTALEIIRFWSNEILKSSKAISFNNFKTNITLDAHLILNFNLIEKERHLKIDKNETKCIFYENVFENEEHCLIICPIYNAGRKSLENICNEICTTGCPKKNGTQN